MARPAPSSRCLGARLRRCLPLLAGAVMLLSARCGLGAAVAQRPHGPSRVAVGPIARAAWLPAGLDELRFDDPHQETLAELGLTHLEWLQRAERDGTSAEALAMAFCSRQGLAMPVYFEPPGYSPYDKLRNWATMTSRPPGFEAQVRARVVALKARWDGEPAFAGYLIGHEDYRADAYASLATVVAALRAVDGERPAITVGAFDSYPQRERFLDAFFPDSGAVNVFQHEHYVFVAHVAPEDGAVQRRLAALVDGYDRIARALRDRNGRWHAIIQVHGERRDGAAFYRPPTAAEIRVQAGLALARGASGVVYFLYSSGIEQVLNSDEEVVQVRQYDGLIDAAGARSDRWEAVRRLNEQLRALSAVLAQRYFLGGYPARRAPADEPVSGAQEDLDLAFFGSAAGTSHVLVVNRRTVGIRQARLELATGVGLRDVEGGATVSGPEALVDLEGGGFRLFEVIR